MNSVFVVKTMASFHWSAYTSKWQTDRLISYIFDGPNDRNNDFDFSFVF